MILSNPVLEAMILPSSLKVGTQFPRLHRHVFKNLISGRNYTNVASSFYIDYCAKYSSHCRLQSDRSNPFRSRITALTMTLKFLKETQDLTTPGCGDGCPPLENVHQLPFEFVIPNSLISARSDLPEDYLNLLPTTRLGPVFLGASTGHVYMRPLITYSLTASAVHMASGKSFRCREEIFVMPITPAAPPLQVEHFQEDYTTICCKPLKQHVWSRPFGKLTASASEPQALNIATCEPRASTRAFIKLIFEPCKAQKSSARPYDWDITVKSSLRVLTFITTQPFTEIPTQERAEKCSLIQMDSQPTQADVRHCDTLPWRLYRISSVGTIRSDSSIIPWTSTLVVPVNASKSLLPTFLSPTAARRYVLVLRIDIGGLSHGTLELEIPVQVTNDPFEKRRYSDGLIGGNLPSPILYESVAIKLEDCESLLTGDTVKPPPYARH